MSSKPNLPVSLDGAMVIAGSAPEAILERETGQPRRDRVSGLPRYQIQVAIILKDGAGVISVKIAGDPGPIAPGTPIRIDGLTMTPWEIDGKVGISYAATKIEVVTGTNARAAS